MAQEFGPGERQKLSVGQLTKERPEVGEDGKWKQEREGDDEKNRVREKEK